MCVGGMGEGVARECPKKCDMPFGATGNTDRSSKRRLLYLKDAPVAGLTCAQATQAMWVTQYGETRQGPDNIRACLPTAVMGEPPPWSPPLVAATHTRACPAEGLARYRLSKGCVLPRNNALNELQRAGVRPREGPRAVEPRCRQGTPAWRSTDVAASAQCNVAATLGACLALCASRDTSPGSVRRGRRPPVLFPTGPALATRGPHAITFERAPQ